MATDDAALFYPDHQWHIAEVRRFQEQYGDELRARLVRLHPAKDED